MDAQLTVGGIVDILRQKFPWMPKKRMSERIQHWTRLGLLYTCDEVAGTGSGTHRLYDQKQVFYAAILFEFSCYNLQVGDLKAIVAFIHNGFVDFPPKDNDSDDLFAMARKGTPVILVYKEASRYPWPGKRHSQLLIAKTVEGRWEHMIEEFRSALIVRLDILFKGL